MPTIRKKENKGKALPAKATEPKKRGRKPKAAAVVEPEKSTAVEAIEAEAEVVETALARVDPNVAIDSPYSKTFVREAQRLDERIVKTIERIQKDVIALGEMFGEMQTKGYHIALGFSTFTNYLQARWPEQSKTQVFQAMRIVRELTQGDHPAVSKEDVREMPRNNAEGLAKLKSAGVEITPQLIEDAKTLPIRRFQEDIVLPQLPEQAQRERARDGLDLAPEPEIFVVRKFTLSGTVSSNLSKAIEVAKWLTSNTEHDPKESFDDRVIDAIVGEFLSRYQADFEEIMRVERAKAMHAAQTTEDALGPDVPEEEAEEYRVPTMEKEEHEHDGNAEVAATMEEPTAQSYQFPAGE
jgi:hypothetical protein